MDVYIHNGNTLKKQVIKYIICLIPLYLYGFYKNGILLYNKDLVGIIDLFKIFNFLVLGFIAYLVTNKILKKKIEFDLTFLSLFLIPLFLPYNTNIILYFIVMFISLLFRKYYNMTFIILIFSLLFSYKTPADIENIYNFSVFDLLLGRCIGAIGSTSIILGFIIGIILSFITDYKYLISLSGLMCYLLLSVIFGKFDFLTLGTPILTLIFISSFGKFTPMEQKYQVIYGFFVSILGFILIYLGIGVGMIISSFIFRLIYKYGFDKRYDLRYNYTVNKCKEEK